MELEKYITVLTFIPWVLIIMVSMLFNLNNDNYNSFSLKYFNRNIFKIFRIDTLLLLVFFWYFSSFDKEFVSKYLFAIMCLYLFVNFFYEQKNSLKKDFFKHNLLQIIFLIIAVALPFIYYHNTNNLDLTYKIMLLYLFLEYPIILLANYVSHFLNAIYKKTFN